MTIAGDFIKSTDHQPTYQWPTDQRLLIHRPSTYRPTNAIIYLKDLKIARYSLCRTQTQLGKCEKLLRSRKSFDLLASIKKKHKLVTFHAWKFLLDQMFLFSS